MLSNSKTSAFKTTAFKTAATALAVALLACEASAQTPPNTAPASVEAGHYAIEPHHTQVNFAVNHMGFSLYDGRFSDVSGALDLDPKKASASTVSITVPVASVSTTSPKLDGELKDVDWLDAAKYPTMTFKSTSVAPDASGTAKVSGDLTMHGVTKTVTMDVRFIGSGVNPLSKKYTAGFAMTADIKRSDFGVKKYVPLIGDAVHLTINAAFEKQ